MTPLYRHATFLGPMAAKEKHRNLHRFGTPKHAPLYQCISCFLTRGRKGTTPKKLIAAKSSLFFLFLPYLKKITQGYGVAMCALVSLGEKLIRGYVGRNGRVSCGHPVMNEFFSSRVRGHK